jgi:hypothetical protein
MEDNKNVKAILKWNPIDRRSRGRPKTRWKDDVGADQRAMKITNWRTRIEDKLAWKKIVEQAKTHPPWVVKLIKKKKKKGKVRPRTCHEGPEGKVEV